MGDKGIDEPPSLLHDTIMTVLFAAPDMDPAPWRAWLQARLPNHPVVDLGEGFDPARVRYASRGAIRPGR